MTTMHTFEVPVYSRISKNFKEFIDSLGSPITESCMVQFWRGKLTFSSTSLDTKVSVVPIPSEGELSTILSQVALFATKFNISMSIRGLDMDTNIQLITDTELTDTDISSYQTVPNAIIRVTVTCKNVATEIALNNFFMVLRPSIEN